MAHEKDFESVPPRFTYCDMDDATKKDVVDWCRESMKLQHDGELKYYKDMAIHVKTNTDKKLKGSWHVIVGNNPIIIVQVLILVLLLATNTNAWHCFILNKLVF